MQRFKAKVSGNMIAKATRLFNAAIEQILTELLQNARRAGATVISISYIVRSDNDNNTILDFCVSDNGTGCKDPQQMFHLGQSAWKTDITSAEDPAGMGVFALAGCDDVKIVSKAADTEAWTVYLENDHFNGKADIVPLLSDMKQPGTEIYFSKVIQSRYDIDDCIADVCRYLPVKVICNGAPVAQKDFLGDALYTEEHQGITYAVYRWQHAYFPKQNANINFYGHVMNNNSLPVLSTDVGQLFIRVDVRHTDGLELVLPQRREVVKNQKFDAVCAYAHKVLYKYISDNNITHYLPYKVYEHAQSLGYDIGEARPQLAVLCGKIDSKSTPIDVTDTSVFLPSDIMEKWHDTEHEFMACWVSASESDRITFVKPASAYEGYGWYQSIPKVTDVILWCNGAVYSKDNDPRPPQQVGWQVQDVHIELQLSNGRSIKHPIAVFVSGLPGITLDNIKELWIDPGKICLDDIIYLFEQYMFDYYGSDNSFDEDWKYFKICVLELAIHTAFKDERMQLIEEIVRQSGLMQYLDLGESYTITKYPRWQAKVKPNLDLWFWIGHVCRRVYDFVKPKPKTT